MGEFTAEVRERAGVMGTAAGLELRPAWWSWERIGGAAQAEIEVVGPGEGCWSALGWLGWRVVIRNGRGTAVWWGLVTEATVRMGAAEVGASLGEMRNRVRVLYSYADGDGNVQSGKTAWAENGRSVAAFGRRELVHSLGEGGEGLATATRDKVLGVRGLPQSVARLSEGGAAGGAGARGARGATLRCEGYWSTLGWVYYENPVGRLVFEGSGQAAEQAVGWRLVGNQIGFDSRAETVCDLQARLGALREGARVVVSGSGSNNGAFEVVEGAKQEEQVVVVGRQIRFDPLDDILDGAEKLDQLAAGEMIQVSGSGSNNRYWFIKDGGADHITVRPGDVAAEGAGAEVTIVQGNGVRVAPAPVLERPGATVTITETGQRVAQRYTPGEAGAWTAGEVLVRLRKEGSPADGVRVQICADSGGSLGAALETVVMGGADVPAYMGWVTFALGNTTVMEYGSYYWLVVDRTGAASAEGHYVVEVDEGLGYADGGLLLFDGTSWGARTPDGDLLMQVWGKRAAGEQVVEIVEAAGGEWLRGAENLAGATPASRQWRDGGRLALDEARELLEAGTSDGRRLGARVTEDGHVVIEAAPPASVVEWVWGADGRLRRALGGEAEPGASVVGVWMALEGAPDQVEGLTPLSPLFVERAEYRAGEGRWRLEPAGMVSPWDVARVEQG